MCFNSWAVFVAAAEEEVAKAFVAISRFVSGSFYSLFCDLLVNHCSIFFCCEFEFTWLIVEFD